MTKMNKKEFLALIKSNIDKKGYHTTTVTSSLVPRYVYTIGLYEKFGFELIFAGGIYFMKNELLSIFDAVINELKKGLNLNDKKVTIGNFGSFSFVKVKTSWSKLMLLGVFDYYKINEAEVLQIVPDFEHYTLDIPRMENEWNIDSEPIWQWLDHEWGYPVPKNSSVVTNLDALAGKKITEVMRWEENEWEMFAGAGPDVPKEHMRVVSLATILGIDKTLEPAINLNIGKGIWRDANELKWNDWG